MSQQKKPNEGRCLSAGRYRGEYDETDLRHRLFDEYKMLQDKMDKIGAFRFTIKGWSVTALVGGVVASAGKGFAVGIVVSFILVVMLIFFFLEYEQVKHSRQYGRRAADIEGALKRITEGHGLDVFDSFPVPLTAVRAAIGRHNRLRDQRRHRRRKEVSANKPDSLWNKMGPLHVLFYAALIILSIASLAAQFRSDSNKPSPTPKQMRRVSKVISFYPAGSDLACVTNYDC